MRIWIVNPFEEFPVDGTTPLRYGTLSRVLGDRGHHVVWWSSDFSHLTKRNRPQPKKEGNLQYRLVPVPPYRRHVGWARWRSHREFERGFYRMAKEAVAQGELHRPDLVLVGLPPLGVARVAFRLREQWACKVIVDIVDAWPETFLRLFPGGKRARSVLGRVFLRPLFREAERAYRGADAITAVAKTFAELPKRAGSIAPVHVTYLGGEVRGNFGFGIADFGSEESGERGENVQRPTSNVQRSKIESVGRNRLPITNNQEPKTPTRFVYIGAMGRSYDLETVVRASAILAGKGASFELHFAGAGPNEPLLRKLAGKAELEGSVYFHGYLGHAELEMLLAESDVALSPIFDNSWIAFPYKVSDYLCAGLPVINSLTGEVRELLEAHNAGSWYPAGDATRLVEVMRRYCENSDLVEVQRDNAGRLARELFDRRKTYPELAAFLEGVYLTTNGHK